MAAHSETNDQENVIKNLLDNIRLVSQQIKDGESKREECEDFAKDEYWKTVAAVFKALSSETTKISLAFSKPPFPSSKNTEAMVRELEKCMLTLVSVYYSLPRSQGSTLHSHFQTAVLQVLESLQGFTSAIAECINSESHNERLKWTGGVWETAGFVLLKDNKECALKSLKETSELVQDTLGEIEEAKENEGQVEDFLLDAERGNADIWSEQDKEVVNTCIGLVKTVKSTLKKTRDAVSKQGEAETREGIATLDELICITSKVSRVVDDFVCGIYAPVNYTALLQNGTLVTELTGNILKFLRDSKLTIPEDTKWLDFLSHARLHNLDKLKESVLPNQEEG